MKKKYVDQLIQKLIDLRLEETPVIWQLEETRRIEMSWTVVPHPDLILIVVSDKVKITNLVRNPKERIVTNEGGLVTITRLDEGKVYFTTDNGTET